MSWSCRWPRNKVILLHKLRWSSQFVENIKSVFMARLITPVWPEILLITQTILPTHTGWRNCGRWCWVDETADKRDGSICSCILIVRKWWSINWLHAKRSRKPVFINRKPTETESNGPNSWLRITISFNNIDSDIYFPYSVEACSAYDHDVQ